MVNLIRGYLPFQQIVLISELREENQPGDGVKGVIEKGSFIFGRMFILTVEMRPIK